MSLVKATKELLTIEIPLGTCKNCSKPMIGWSVQLNPWMEIILKRDVKHIVKESYGDFGVCKECVKKGGFKRECRCCGKQYEFPRQFKYELTDYADYPEEETQYYYVCKECVKFSPNKVMDMLVDYDEAKDLEKDRD